MVQPSASGSDRSVVQLLPPQSCVSVESEPSAPAPAPAPAQETASTPDLSAGSGTPPPAGPTPPASSPELCRLPKITVGGRPARRRSLPPSATGPSCLAGVAAAPAGPVAAMAAYRRPVAASPRPAPGQPAARHTRSMSVQRAETETAAPPAASAATLRHRRQPSTPHTVTLDLPSPAGFGGLTPARKNGYKPRGLTKIQLASSVPENLTTIVGRKLEISLGGTKRGRQRGKGFR